MTETWLAEAVSDDEAAAHFLLLGLQPHPVPYRSKRCIIDGWEDLRLRHDFYSTAQGPRFSPDPSVCAEMLERLRRLNVARREEEKASQLARDCNDFAAAMVRDLAARGIFAK